MLDSEVSVVEQIDRRVATVGKGPTPDCTQFGVSVVGNVDRSLATTSSTPAARISAVPTIWGQPNGSSVSKAALITPTTSSERIRMPKTPVPIFEGDQKIIAVVGKTKNKCKIV